MIGKSRISVLPFIITVMLLCYQGYIYLKSFAHSTPPVYGLSDPVRIGTSPRVLFYLFPQWHSIPENNRLHSWDLTDWTLIKALVEREKNDTTIQQPSELGWYNQISYDLRKQQASLLREYGGYGFIYHVYWFTDHPIMDEPMRQLLADKDIQLSYIVSWANEDWSRRWANGDGRSLLAVDIGKEENRRKFFNYLLPFFKDERYIRIEGKPVFQVYQANENMNLVFKDFKKWSVEAGLAGLHCHQVLAHFHPFGVDLANINQLRLPVTTLADGVTEFQPNLIKSWSPHHHLETTRIVRHHPKYHWRGLHVDWDNRPRHNSPRSLRSHPYHFEQHLRAVLRTMQAEIKNYSLSWNDQYITVNGWNEWSEGNTVEPSNIYGRGYLEAVQIVMMKPIKENQLCIIIAGSQHEDSYQLFTNTIRSIQIRLADTNWEALIILNDPTPNVPVDMMEFIRHLGDARVRMIDIPIHLQQKNTTDESVLSYVLPHCHDVRKSHYVTLLNEGDQLIRKAAIPIDWESPWKLVVNKTRGSIVTQTGERLWLLETSPTFMRNFTSMWQRTRSK